MDRSADSADCDAEVTPIGTSPEDDVSETIPETTPGERKASVTGHPAFTSRQPPNNL